MRELTKKDFPLCYAVRHKKGRGVFRNQFQKVEGDSDFIRRLVRSEDWDSIQFMETFYADLVKSGYNAARRDIFSVNNYRYSPIPKEIS